LAKALADIRRYADGNENHRELAVDRIRVLAEQFIRELHAKVLGFPAPPEYDNAQPNQLLKLFTQITGTTPTEHAGLKDTIGFADPAHHSEVGYSVPQKSNIQPHIDRLDGLMKKHRLI
jgi:hypothetical protein